MAEIIFHLKLKVVNVCHQFPRDYMLPFEFAIIYRLPFRRPLDFIEFIL